jgi:2,3-bisphosphoglycerate-dependent phosphoglycerate mutase
MAYLILVRHGVTDWNVEGRWHGLSDIPINAEGEREATQAGEALKDLKIDAAYTSDLIRTKQTYQKICDSLKLTCPVEHTPALNERDYGMFTGKNKWEVRETLGEEEFLKLRRDYKQAIPGGESLQDVYGRVVPFYQDKIMKDLISGKNVLVVSSGNTLRALIKHLENISDEDISKFELNFGEIRIFHFNENGKIIDKEIRGQDLFQGKK